MIHRGVNEIDAAEKIIRVIEMLDEMAQAFRRIGREMKDVFKVVLFKKFFHQVRVCDRALDEFDAGWNVIKKPTAQIIQANDLLPLREQMSANMRADEARRAC